MRASSRFLALIVAVLAVVVGVVAVRNDARAHEATARAQPEAKANSASRYRIHAEQHLDLNTSDDVDGTLSLAFDAVCVMGPKAAQRRAMVCSEAQLSATGPQAAALDATALAALEADLHTEHVLHLSADGHVQGIAFAHDVDPLAAGLLRQLASSMQFVRGSGTHYDTNEVDATGAHEATYDGSDVLWRKTKHNHHVDGAKATGEIHARLTVHGGEMETVDEQGELHMAPSVGMPMRWRTATTVRRIGDAPVSLASATADDLFPEGREFLSLANTHVSEKHRRQQDLKILEGKSFATLMADWTALPVADGDAWGQARVHFQSQLEALLRTDPHAAVALQARIAERARSDEGVDLDLSHTLIAALGSDGGPAAQHSLVQLAQDDALTDEERRVALQAAGLVETPNDRTMTALKDLATTNDGDGLHHTAAYALGNAAAASRQHAQRGDDTARQLADDAFAELVQQLEAATSLEDQLVWMTALENTGDARLLDVAVSYVQSDIAELRASAARLPRLVMAPAAVTWLEGMTQHQDEAVAVSAARALRERPFELERFAQLIVRPPLAHARLELLGWAAPQRHIDGVHALLEQLRAQDPSEEVRSAIDSLLTEAG